MSLPAKVQIKFPLSMSLLRFTRSCAGRRDFRAQCASTWSLVATEVVSAKGSGAHPLLNRAAEDNARLWAFSAPLPESATKLTVTYVWRLEGKEQERYDSAAVVTLDFPNRVEVVAHPPRPGT